jgi:oligopeptide/dipeptide ABC transporter ATP-binding protein
VHGGGNLDRLLEVRDLKTYFNTDSGVVKAVDGVSYHIDEQDIVGLVGESGCGKSVSQLSVMQLVQTPPGQIVAGEIIFEGKNLLKFKSYSDEMRSVRGGKIAMIFQEPMTSLNPVITISKQLTEILQLHLQMDRRAARKRAIELLELVGIPDAKMRIDDYPHQLSGGMRQRVMIAMALSCAPKIVIADEPTTAVDVTTQAQLLEIMTDMVARFKTSLIIVTHNLGIVARYANRIYVMYAGKIVETATSEDIFGDPRHPYTISLLRSVPRLDEPRRTKLTAILGMPPNLIDHLPVCAFRPRCTYAEQCQTESLPELRQVTNEHYVRCHLSITKEAR